MALTRIFGHNVTVESVGSWGHRMKMNVDSSERSSPIPECTDLSDKTLLTLYEESTWSLTSCDRERSKVATRTRLRHNNLKTVQYSRVDVNRVSVGNHIKNLKSPNFRFVKFTNITRTSAAKSNGFLLRLKRIMAEEIPQKTTRTLLVASKVYEHFWSVNFLSK